MYCDDCPFKTPWRGNDNERPPPVVTAAPALLLMKRSYYWRLAVATANLGMSRRKLADEIVEAIFFYEGEILWPDGTPFDPDDTFFDDLFGNDGGFRWLSSFMALKTTPPKRAPQARVLERLRMIDLFFKIKHPSIARHFGR